jgi:hypothetical protein
MSATISRAGVAVHPRRIVDHDVDDRVGGQDPERHLIEVVEAVGRHGEGPVDRLVRFALPGHVDPSERPGGGEGLGAGGLETTPERKAGPLSAGCGGVTVMSLAAGRFRANSPCSS